MWHAIGMDHISIITIAIINFLHELIINPFTVGLFAATISHRLTLKQIKRSARTEQGKHLRELYLAFLNQADIIRYTTGNDVWNSMNSEIKKSIP